MLTLRSWKCLAFGLSLIGAQMFAPAQAMAAGRVTIAVTETIASINPYADSVLLMYNVWCQTYGCMTHYNPDTQTYTSDFFESWQVEDPNTWVFTMRPGIKRHNGEPVVAEDFIHSINRIKTDPQSRQAYHVADIKEVLIRDPRTIVIKTKKPSAPLLDYMIFTIVTSKAQYDKYGRDADREAPYGIGPYKLKKIVIDNYLVLEKDPTSPQVTEDNPDELVFQIMREPEQRITALFNGEVQIAQFIPPHLVQRVQDNPSVKIAISDTVEAMFVAMSPLYPPFDKKEVRQAVGYAIDRDTIINRVLQGQATKLNAPVGPGQIGYSPDIANQYTYDPAKSRELLRKAGYPNGAEVDFNATVGRYTLDKQLCEAIAQMLNRAGFKVNLKTPEWSTLWANVQKGGVPFYYMGRGTIIDPSAMLQQYFGTGGSPRIGYSNSELDKLLTQERESFDHDQRMKVLQQIFALINDEAPAFFLWRHQWAWGLSKNVDFQPEVTGDIWGWKIKFRSDRPKTRG
jgi:peptide/nickel transport system substrate-binding protein